MFMPKPFLAGFIDIKKEVLPLLKVKVGGVEKISLKKQRRMNLKLRFLTFKSNVKVGGLVVAMLKQC